MGRFDAAFQMQKEPRGPTPPTAAEVAETHISWIFLTPTRAFKLLKPVEMPFFDHRAADARIEATTTELELNRRIAPDVYLGLAPVEEEGAVVDQMIVMRRMPALRRLSALVDDPDFADHLRAIARLVAGFHATQPPVSPAPMATIAAVRKNWRENFDVLDDVVGSVIDPDDADLARTQVENYLLRRDELFDKRISDGWIRDGHGDLIADDIYCLVDGPRILDCLAFNDEWRIGDVLADIGFLVMDVDRLAGADAAAALMAHYQEFSYEHHPPSLAHHYVAYRAMVRAKVAALRFGQGHAPSAATVREYHDLALDHLERARLRLVMVGGGSGVGKSTLARGLGAHFGYPVLATDEVRKSVTGTTAGVHRFSAPGKGIYDTVTTNRVYDEVLREAGLVLRSGRGVVLDASWSSAEHRAAVRDLATDHGVELVEVEAVLDPAIAKERIARRMADPWNPSDATPEVVDYQVSRRDPWPTAIVVSTALPPREVCANALSQIDSVRPRPLVQQ